MRRDLDKIGYLPLWVSSQSPMGLSDLLAATNPDPN